MPDEIGALREIGSVVEFFYWVTGGGSVVFLSLITGCIEGGEVAKKPSFFTCAHRALAYIRGREKKN